MKNQKIRVRILPLAVFVRRGIDSFPELLKTLRINVDSAVTEEKISKLKEMKNGAESAEAVRVVIEKSLRPGGSIRNVMQGYLIELTDLTT